MLIRWLLAAVHLLALAVGFGAVWMRANALRGVPDSGAVLRVLRADVWGVAAMLWLGTGLTRLFMASEKPTAFYFANHFFWLKLALFTAIVALEVGAALALGRWRSALRQGRVADTSSAPRLLRISQIELALIILIVLAATAMARGIGA